MPIHLIMFHDTVAMGKCNSTLFLFYAIRKTDEKFSKMIS